MNLSTTATIWVYSGATSRTRPVSSNALIYAADRAPTSGKSDEAEEGPRWSV